MIRAIPGLFGLLLLCIPTAGIGFEDNQLPGFAAYLRDANLAALYRTELRTLCTEDANLYACFEHGRLYEGDAVERNHPTLADSITWTDQRRRMSAELVRASLSYEFGQYGEALNRLNAIVEELPDKDILVEAALMRAQCRYHLGDVDEALMGLRSVRPHLPESRAADVALYLGLCEEAAGNLVEAENLIEEAERQGSPDAVINLLRVNLKQGDIETFRVIAKEVAGTGEKAWHGEICDLADQVGRVLPEAWYALMNPVLGDSGFTVEDHPEVVESIVHLAEGGQDMSLYCGQLLSRHPPAEMARRLRYTRALSVEDTAFCDTLAVLFRTASSRDLRLRCLDGCLTHAEADRREAVVDGLVPRIRGLWKDLTAEERLTLADQLARLGRGEFGRSHIADLADGLETGHDDGALLQIASALERAGDIRGALSLYAALSTSPLPSEHTLQAERAAYLLEHAGRPEVDVADMVEQVAQQDADLVGIGDLFMEKLHDFPRAAGFYREALTEAPEGVSIGQVKLKLAKALAGQALVVGDRSARDDAMRLVEDLADTNTVRAGEILRVLRVSTDWLEEDRGRAFNVVVALSRRQNLASEDLYQAARVLFHLFRERDGNIYAQCALTLRRLAKEHPISEEAPLGSFLAAKLKFLAGDYVAALESYQACREVWRRHDVASLCDEGIGDCYLHSGGIEEALHNYGKVPTSPGLAFKKAQCHELLEQPDSALRYYTLAYGQVGPLSVGESLSLHRGLLLYERDGTETALAALDSPFSSIRERCRSARQVVAAYALGRAGYVDLVRNVLAQVEERNGEIGCYAPLLLSRLEQAEEPSRGSRLPEEGGSPCQSIFGTMRLLYERAYLACSSGPMEACLEESKRYLHRFPLDRRSRLRFDVHQALLLYREGRGDTATSIIDSLAAAGHRDEVLAYGLYREGIHHMVEGDYARAVAVFHEVETGYPESDLYYDTAFKLGTGYYMLEDYDSSAVHFRVATGAGKAPLVEDACFNLGLALEEAGSLEEASQAFRSLAVRFPFTERFERALMRAAFTLEQAGRPGEAITLYESVLRYAQDPETAAEALYWIGESFSEMDRPLRAACEFLRMVHLFPGGGPWAGTAAFRAGMECEKAGLIDHALIVYRRNVSEFGIETDWGRASKERLDELEGSQEDAPVPIPLPPDGPGESTGSERTP